MQKQQGKEIGAQKQNSTTVGSVKEHNYSVSKDQCNYNGWSDGHVIKRRSKAESNITSISYC